MENKLSPPRMYILMRNDLASMTPGRACAQASHAANECVKFIHDSAEQSNDFTQSNLLALWEEEAESFGTTIVLGANLNQIDDVFSKVEQATDGGNITLNCGITHDPEYAIRDGETVHLIPLDTCMWIFGRVDDVKPYVEHLNLY